MKIDVARLPPSEGKRTMSSVLPDNGEPMKKSFYVRRIYWMLRKCTDASLLDLIYRLLKKSM